MSLCDALLPMSQHATTLNLILGQGRTRLMASKFGSEGKACSTSPQVAPLLRLRTFRRAMSLAW